MLQTGARPDAFTLPLLNRAAASLPGFVGTAHCFGIRAGFGGNVYFCNTLLEAYTRHGLVAPANQVFDEMRVRDVVSWTTLVSAYAGAWDPLEVSQLVTAMRTNGDCEPSAVTLSVVLRACTDMRDAIGGRQLHCYAVKSGWAGNLEEALQVIIDMNVKPDGRIWGALLASCRMHSNSKLAAFAAQKLVELEPDNVGYHVVFSNVHAGSGRWAKVEDIRSSMIGMNMEKSPAWSCVSDIGVP
ncbi:pentatricopeptide repeat-containing protein At3g24000, mitochondrial-like [Panicum virgatum]|uniref:pentatricopeptide repeat-containing protein At3g24000, mitochondrial-like n=1 Tax=Panicum virgatum TaxID=38727 RepID=UPI0019D52F9A|nr:pentatricopeptide repeat-containing protein At3g24000, mitochondrial-like [Panicum virgatum]